MTAALAELGETDRAKKQIEHALRIVPKLTARGIPGCTIWKDIMPVFGSPGFPNTPSSL
jgi:hypothetical protein